MTSADIRAALLARHPAAGGNGGMVGEWTCTSELWGIDFLAWSAWGKAERHGYEIKVSRSDYRREVLNPAKRARAVAMCHRFSFAVPAGLLTKDELAYREPGDLRPGDFEREPCPGADLGGPRKTTHQLVLTNEDVRPGAPVYGGKCRKMHRYGWDDDRSLTGKHVIDVPVPAVGRDGHYSSRFGVGVTVCPTCGGRGYVAKSRVEQEAPTLWVPADVGLVVVHENGTARTVRKAPVNREVSALSNKQMAEAFRWVSVRPDPRHTRDRGLTGALTPQTAEAG